MNVTIYQCSQLCCVVETLVFGLTLLWIGNSKARSTRWLKQTKLAVAMVMLIVGLMTTAQLATDLSMRYPEIDTALNTSMLYIITFILSIAFIPLASSEHMTRLRVATTGTLLGICIAMVWLAILLDNTVGNIMVVMSLAIYFIELLRITVVFYYNYKQMGKTAHKPGTEENARYECLQLIARSIILLALLALLYIFIVMLTSESKAIHNFVMLMVWGYLFATFVNLIIDYNPLAEAALAACRLPQARKSPTLSHPELNEKLDRWIEDKKFCSPGITMLMVAQDIETNRTYLSEQLNYRFGCTFNTWINQLRINEAKELMLSSPALSIERIATSVGFATKSHFISSFKAIVGTTPGQWRNQKT